MRLPCLLTIKRIFAFYQMYVCLLSNMFVYDEIIIYQTAII